MNNAKKMFRSSVNGYNKNDVNGYIMEITKKFSTAEASYKEEIDRLNKRLSESDEKIKAFESDAQKAAEDQCRLKEALDKISSMNSKEAELAEELEKMTQKYNELISAKEEEKDSSSGAEIESYAPYNAANITDKPESALDKVKLYDEISAQIGNIIINANKSAEDLINKAEETANKLKSDSEEKISAIRTRVFALSSDLVDKINSEMNDNVKSCMKEFSSYIHDLQYTSKNMIDEFEKKYDELSKKINFYTTTMADGINEKIKKYEEECADIEKKNDLQNR